MVGQPINNWILGRELGRGPVGVVFQATANDDPTRQAAVKLLTHPSLTTPDFLDRFPGEFLALHRLSHPNIVSFYDAGVQAGQAWYATELVEGDDLATAIRNRAKQGAAGFRWHEEVLPITVQLLRALKHGHLRSLLHRNLKPSNVLLTPDGVVKVADFGIAKLLNLQPMNLPPDPWGSAGYLAPELFQGKAASRKSDLYSLGGVLYSLLAGRPPFAGGTIAEFLHKHCYTLPERPIHFAPDMLNEFDELICHLLAKDPNRRPASAMAILPAMEQIRGKAERKGFKVPWPDDTGGTSAVLPALTPEQIEEAEESLRPKPLLSRPLVVLPLFMFVVVLLLTLTFWPRPTASELMQQARPLLATDDLEKWEEAWDRYLSPLQDRFPEEFHEEVQSARQKINYRKELQRALDAAGRVKYRSEAERLYQRGLKLCQAGEVGHARRTWQQLIEVYKPTDADQQWVKLAEKALEELAKKPDISTDRSGLLTALERLETLKQSGKFQEAKELLDTLHELYDADPAARELLPKR